MKELKRRVAAAEEGEEKKMDKDLKIKVANKLLAEAKWVRIY